MNDDHACRLLFVYGTLRYDSPHPLACYLASAATFLGRASVAGRLYDLGPYPGMTAATSERVWGHLFEMTDREATLQRLDAYEGCPLGEPIPAHFQRHLMQAVDEQGHAHTAWVYTYHGEVNEEMRVLEGEYEPSRQASTLHAPSTPS
jgi:gamma-glutamylcyclotransferase (GGCT)/AIG2-like uncharacterized protein YtfP